MEFANFLGDMFDSDPNIVKPLLPVCEGDEFHLEEDSSDALLKKVIICGLREMTCRAFKLKEVPIKKKISAQSKKRSRWEK